MALTGRQEEAAFLLAEDRLSDREISQHLGMAPRTLYVWKARPDFSGRVEALRAEIRARIRKRGIAVVERRVDALERRHQLMEQLIEARAKAHAEADEPGASTGLLVPQVKLIKVYDAGEIRLKARDPDQPRADGDGEWSIETILAKGAIPKDEDLEMVENDGDVLFSAKRSVAVIEWTLDAKLLAELRAHEKQAAQDLGQFGADETTMEFGPGKVTITALRYHEPAPADAS